jgi:hypothetical protein
MTGPLIINKADNFDPLAVDVGERPMLDLNHIQFDHLLGDLRVIGTWFAQGQKQPCLVIGEAYRALPKINPCIVPLDNLWRWTEEAGDDVYTALMAIGFCDQLDTKSPHSNADILQVIDTVRARLTDLKNMPPAPLGPRRIAGHMTIRSSEGRTHQKDVWEDV